MCTHSRYIFNPYSRRNVLVSCGKCDACLQQKAQARTMRIRNNVTDGYITLFVTLTYSNDYVPYVNLSDLNDGSFDINVYRNNSGRYLYSRSRGTYFERQSGIDIIDKVYIPLELRSSSELYLLKPLNGLGKDKIGVCLYSDIQKFYKRLRQILHRDYGNFSKFSYFCCTEYGSCTQRPHSHHLIFVPREDEEIFRAAIVKAWPYADKHRTEEYIELAKDAASYVSSYVSGSSRLPSCLQETCFKQKHNASKHFGVCLDCFSLPSILSKIDNGDLYYYRKQEFDGTSCVDAVPIPKYVLNRYFPYHKGFSWLSSSQLYGILLAPERVSNIENLIENPIYHFTPKETYQIYVNIDNCYKYFNSVTGLNRFDYARYFLSCWRQRSSNVIKDSLLDVEDFTDFYENANDFENGIVQAPTLTHLHGLLQVNPNLRKDVVTSDFNYRRLFILKDKQRKVTNYCLSALGHNF